VAENSSLGELIRFAYQVKEYQLVGPTWLNDDSECFDILAKASWEAPELELRLMLRALLVERFRLETHRETRTMPILKLVIGKKGARLHEASVDGARPGTSSAGGDVTATHVFMSAFAYWLSRELRRPVFDGTGLNGRFDFRLQYDAGHDDVGRPSLVSALHEQLGLRLENGKGLIDILVIDHVEKVPNKN